MFKKLNQKISLGLFSATMVAAPALSFAATVDPLGDGATCGDKKVFLNGCTAKCVDGATIKTGETTKNCIITYGKDSITVSDVLTKVITWLTTFVGIIAVLFLIYGGLVYITSAGNKDRAENAKKIITYSVLGLIVVILARVIVSLVVNTAGEAI